MERILNKLGYDTNILLSPDPNTGLPSMDWTNASSMADNMMSRWLRGNNALIWHIGGTGEGRERLAQRIANNGNVVIAVWRNPTTGLPGHVAIVAPTLEDYNAEVGPLLGQAGSQNGFMSLQSGFGDNRNDVEFYEILKLDED